MQLKMYEKNLIIALYKKLMDTEKNSIQSPKNFELFKYVQKQAKFKRKQFRIKAVV